MIYLLIVTFMPDIKGFIASDLRFNYLKGMFFGWEVFNKYLEVLCSSRNKDCTILLL